MNSILEQNVDIFNYILSFLVDDGNSVIQFALSSKQLYDRILRQESSNPDLWKNLILHRWERNLGRPAIAIGSGVLGANCLQEDHTVPSSYRELYTAKRRADAEAMRRLQRIASILQTLLKLNETEGMVSNHSPHIGRAWEHRDWNSLLRNRADCYDVFKSTARRHFGTAASSVDDKLLAFLAARCVQDMHFVDSLLEWKRLLENGIEEQHSQTHSQTQAQAQASELKEVHLLEKFVFLICEIQKTPSELIHEDILHSYCHDMLDENSVELTQEDIKVSPAQKLLDEIAKVCKDRIDEELGTCASVTSKVKVVSDVLVNRYGFVGNAVDYYNYHNVLLDRVLESKTGMPLTLCVLYGCVCRRLGISVQVTGLPGHIVLGFDTKDSSGARRSFIDVFNGCRLLSADDCRRIVVESYGINWREEFLDPLSTKMTIQRIFNNLRNCHEKAIGQADPPLFCSDLMFQQHTLGMVHRYPPEIATTMLDRLTIDLAIGLSPDLLRAYNLLSPRSLKRDPVVNATHARALLELSSYVGLAYHNYA